MAFAMEFSEEKQHNQRMNPSEQRAARLNAQELGYQPVAYVEPAQSVVRDLWDVTAGDNRTYLGTFTTAELLTATSRLLNRHSRMEWMPGQEKKFGDPRVHGHKRRPSRRGRGRKSKSKSPAL